MERLKCDKPYNVDEARKAKGLPRRKRKDPRTIQFELCIRVPKEYQEVVQKKKFSKTVYVLNKKTDLKQRIREFEDEKTALIESQIQADAALKAQFSGSPTACTPFKDYLNYYIDVRVGSVKKATTKNERSCCRYLSASIGDIALKDITPNDIDDAIRQVPVLSERWAIQRREERLAKRKATAASVHHRTLKPLAPIKIAGPDKQYKVLKFAREALNFAMDKEIIDKNVAKAKFLSRLYKKSKPKIDPLMPDEAARFLREVERLPTSYFKVWVLLLFNSGMRPEEDIPLCLGSFNFTENDPCVNVTMAIEHGTNEVVDYSKTDASFRSIPIDISVAEEVKKWAALLKEQLAEMGIAFNLRTPLMSEYGQVMTYNTFKTHWDEFVKKIGFEGMRPYALRHTYATINLANGENVKTLSVLMGHESTAYTTDLYAAYIPNTKIGIGQRYMSSIRNYQMAA